MLQSMTYGGEVGDELVVRRRMDAIDSLFCYPYLDR